MTDFLKQLATTVIAIALVVFIIMQLVVSAGVDIEVESAIYTTVRDMTEMECYIFRDEVLVQGSVGSTASYLFDDGEKVKAGDQVAYLYKNESDAATSNRIAEIEKSIDMLEASAISEGATTTDINVILSRITELCTIISECILKDDLEAAVRYKEELNIQMNRSAALSQSLKDYESRISELKSEAATLRGTLSKDRETAKSPSSGYFFTDVDGYEGQFTLDSLYYMTVSGFDRLGDLKADQKSINSSAGKIVRSENWYMLCRTDKKTAEAYKAGRSYDIVFPYSSGTELGCVFERCITQSDSDVALAVFSCNVMPDGLSYTRSQTVQVVGGTYSGLRISVEALRIKDDVQGVYILDGSVIKFKTAEVLCRQGNYYVCALPVNPQYPDRVDKSYISSTALSLYDTVITSGTGIYEGVLVR